MAQQAVLYRIVTDQHVCPFGLKARDLLTRRGFNVDDQILASREEIDAFKSQHAVETTPQIFIDGERIGGFDALQAHLGIEAKNADATTYRPVIAIFAMALLMALATSWAIFDSVLTVRAFELFIAYSMCILAIQKLQDIDKFATMFITYDLLAMRWLPYAKMYPFGEAIAGIVMLSGTLVFLGAPIALFIGTVGAVSVIKAVYVDRRELKCACVGGDSNVPLGFISLTENLMMIAMAVWMLAMTVVGV